MSLHDSHNQLGGRGHHFARAASLAAVEAGHFDERCGVSALCAHRAANRAKHVWRVVPVVVAVSDKAKQDGGRDKHSQAAVARYAALPAPGRAPCGSRGLHERRKQLSLESSSERAATRKAAEDVQRSQELSVLMESINELSLHVERNCEKHLDCIHEHEAESDDGEVSSAAADIDSFLISSSVGCDVILPLARSSVDCEVISSLPLASSFAPPMVVPFVGCEVIPILVVSSDDGHEQIHGPGPWSHALVTAASATHVPAAAGIAPATALSAVGCDVIPASAPSSVGCEVTPSLALLRPACMPLSSPLRCHCQLQHCPAQRPLWRSAGRTLERRWTLRLEAIRVHCLAWLRRTRRSCYPYRLVRMTKTKMTCGWMRLSQVSHPGHLCVSIILQLRSGCCIQCWSFVLSLPKSLHASFCNGLLLKCTTFYYKK